MPRLVGFVAFVVGLWGCGGGGGTGGSGGDGGANGGPCQGKSGAHSLTWADGGTMPVSYNAVAVSTGDFIAVYSQGHFYQYEPGDAEWTSLASPAEPREGPIATDGAKVYLVGGHTFSGPLSRVEAYDIASGTWSDLPSLPEARTSNNAFVIGDFLYSLGGETTPRGPTTKTVWAYDLTANDAGTWTERAPLSFARGLGAAAVDGGLGYLIGGAAALNFVGSTEGESSLNIYDPSSDEWVTGPAMPNDRAMLYNAASVCGALYVVGGRDGDVDLDSVDTFDLDAATWFASTSLTLARSSHGVVGHEGKLYVFGGFSSTAGSSTNSVEIGTPNEPID